MKNSKIEINLLEEKKSEILIKNGILKEIGFFLKESQKFSNFGIILTDKEVAGLYLDELLSSLKENEFEVLVYILKGGEESKSWKEISKILDFLSSYWKIERDSFLISLGGGIVGDVGGFVASIYLRGIYFIQVPTTLLAQVDSAIGGKTGINTKYGKNLIGTFYQPIYVFIDPQLLLSLPQKEYQNGFAEIIKYSLIKDKELFFILKDKKAQIKNRDLEVLQGIIEKCCVIKAKIVESDEKEKTGQRFILNFGHTIGHAIETVSDYKITHPEAVGLGMAAESLVSCKLGYLKEEKLKEIFYLLQNYGFVTNLPEYIDKERLKQNLLFDKKKKREKLNFVLLNDIGSCFLKEIKQIDFL